MKLSIIHDNFTEFMTKFKKDDYKMVVNFLELVIAEYNENPDKLSSYLF